MTSNARRVTASWPAWGSADGRASCAWTSLRHQHRGPVVGAHDPLRLARWLGEVEGDLRLGGEYRARFFASGWEGTVAWNVRASTALRADQRRRRTPG